MPLQLIEGVDRLDHVSRQTFKKKYLTAGKPVIIRNFFGKDAPLYKKWTFDYLKKELGDLEVGVFDAQGVNPMEDRSYKRAPDTMKLGEYLDLVQQRPTTRRLMLFNIFKYKKEMVNDYVFPDLDNRVVKKIPMGFFGGKGAVTRLHRDADNCNGYLTELVGTKRVILFDPRYSDLLYRYPLCGHTSIDIKNPDYEAFPALDKVVGLDCTIGPGDTLFIPAGWFHYIEYESPGIGFTIRSLSANVGTVLKGALRFGLLTHIDDLLRVTLGGRWFKYKRGLAERKALRALRGAY